MLLDKPPEPNHGNLMSYKVYVRPAARAKYGYSTIALTKHQKSIHSMLRLLMTYGPCTTWDMASIRRHNVSFIREKEREYRRLFIGRTDGRRRTDGILDIGLVVREKKVIGKKISWKYRLSLHGMLYCMDALNLTNDEIDVMASTYAESLPKVFGIWHKLRSVLGDDTYKIRILSKALMFESAKTTAIPDNPMRELMDYIHVRHAKGFESISEHGLAEQVSCWFYTYMLYYRHPRSARIPQRSVKTRRMLHDDSNMYRWYREFFDEAQDHYKSRFQVMKKSGRP